MAKLRHATVVATAARASSSPAKRDAEAASSTSSTFIASPRGSGDGKDGAVRSSAPFHQRYSLPPPVSALLALEDPRSPTAPVSYRILLAVVACLALVALVWSRFNAPYLCIKDGIRLQCPTCASRILGKCRIDCCGKNYVKHVL